MMVNTCRSYSLSRASKACWSPSCACRMRWASRSEASRHLSAGSWSFLLSFISTYGEAVRLPAYSQRIPSHAVGAEQMRMGSDMPACACRTQTGAPCRPDRLAGAGQEVSRRTLRDNQKAVSSAGRGRPVQHGVADRQHEFHHRTWWWARAYRGYTVKSGRRPPELSASPRDRPGCT